MDAPLQQRLREVVERYGAEVTDDPKRARAVLADTFYANKREASLLITAVEEGVTRELRERAGDLPPAVLRAQLEQRLVHERSISAEGAAWAVAAWAHALGLELGPAPVPPVARAADGAETEPVEESSPAADPRDAAGGGWVLPPDASGSELGRNRRLRWAIGIAVGVIVLLILIGVAARLGEAPNPTPTLRPPPSSPTPRPPTFSPTLTTGTTFEYEALLRWIPSAIRSGCVPNPDLVDTLASAQAACAGTAGERRGYAQFESLQALRNAYSGIRDANFVDEGEGSCPTDPPGENTWHYDATEAISRGRYMCYVDASGAPWLVMAADHAQVLAWMSRPEGSVMSLDDLHAAWEKSVGVLPPP